MAYYEEAATPEFGAAGAEISYAAFARGFISG